MAGPLKQFIFFAASLMYDRWSQEDLRFRWEEGTMIRDALSYSHQIMVLMLDGNPDARAGKEKSLYFHLFKAFD